MDSLSAGFRRFPGVVLLGIAFAIAYGGTAVSAPRSEGPARTYDYDAPAASETPTTNLRIDTSEARTGARASSGAVRLVVGRFHEVSYSFDPGANSTDLRAQRRSRSHGYDSPAATTTPAANLRIAALLANRHPAGNSLPSPLSLARGRATKGDGTVSVFHGSIDDAARIRGEGLDSGRAPTWASRDRRAADDAIDPAVRGRAGRDPGIVESRIPRNVFDDLFAPAERGYGGFFPYRLGRSSEIVMRSRQQIEAFNRHRVR